jgi:hypothetical protein
MTCQGGLIILQMLGAYVHSALATHIPTLWVPLEFSLIKYTVVVYSGTSSRVIVYEHFGFGRVITLFTGCCSADDLSPLIGIVAW